MASKVYFADFSNRGPGQNTLHQISFLFDSAGFPAGIEDGDLTAIKVHFGERGCDTHINPVFVRTVADRVKEAGGKPFLTDTNTLYSGCRRNAADHLETALLHGFGYEVTAAPIIIADGLVSEYSFDVKINGKHFDSVHIGGIFQEADGMVVMSHFKGHDVAGFGGAIKNLGMGCASSAGKRDQHRVLQPVVDREKCVGCSNCVKICIHDAVYMVEEKAYIEPELCVSCGQCAEICPEGAISFDYGNDIVPFIERIVEYASGAVMDWEDKVCYMNFVMNVTPECDCVTWSRSTIVPDIGILASSDPVAIDSASYDLVNSAPLLNEGDLYTADGSPDWFRAVNAHTRGEIQLKYGEEIGLGKRDYELIRL